MPIFFVIGIATFLLDIVELVIGARLAALGSLVFWTLSVLALGNGIDWDRRVMFVSGYASMVTSACIIAFAVLHH